MDSRHRAFVNFAWLNVGYNLLVIMWGAFVRATGSGAGCGDHWPLCDGQVIPRAPDTAQMIEFSHRVTSGIALLLAVALLVWALRLFAAGHPARRAAIATMVFMIVESLIGAALVLFRLVAHDVSLTRALSLGLHLINTFLLIGAMALTAWYASGKPAPELRGKGGLLGMLIAALIGTALVGSSGAVTALGDTLLQLGVLPGGVSQAITLDSHPLVWMRIIHPVLGTLVGLAMITLAQRAMRYDPSPATRRLAWATAAIFVGQIFLGTINVILKAPVWMQLVHLLFADLAWLTLVLLSATLLARPSTVAALHAPVVSGSPAR
ncbi:cytochrome oxidase assembly protein [Chloroflexus islandicus]|uniref:Cytochrome oxidase assembly protein n=1 Tax=Chloroflexus islandicus TaxID=1707952 RepID=A0A178M772_9CHLR|nr:COX15/CtaA family protein [Chloroflexus islandicus]OAN44592.1 cytochrome oxidase assembly protein [Chloroflexus islandicus]